MVAEQAESSLQYSDIVGVTCRGREGSWVRKRQRWEKADTRERRSMVQDEIRREEEQSRSARAVQMAQQGR